MPDESTSERAKAIGSSVSIAKMSDDAKERYRTFHAKEPDAALRLRHELPKQVYCDGFLLSEMYRSDKWYEAGDEEDYKHLHGEGVRFLRPCDDSRMEAVIEELRYPRQLTLLGECLGFFYQDHDGETWECNPTREDRWWLMCSPKGDQLFFYSERDGFVGIGMGGALRVEEDGIDG